jgi:hypothetical protein
LSETEATEALMARLSYAATIRAREICRLSRQLLNLHQTAKLAFTVAPLVRITKHLYSYNFFLLQH